VNGIKMMSWGHQEARIARRHDRLQEELRMTIIQLRIAGSNGLSWLPPIDPEMSDDDLRFTFSELLSPWSENPGKRLEILMRACPPGDKDAYLLLRFLLKGWIKEFSRRQIRLAKRWHTRGGDQSARNISLHNRDIITRLISIRRSSRRYAGHMAEMARNL